MTGWGEALEMEVDLPGATLLHFDEDSKIKEFWLYYHDPPSPD